MGLLRLQSAGEGELRHHRAPSGLTASSEARLVQRVSRAQLRQAKRYGLEPEVRRDIVTTAHRDMLHGQTVKERQQAARTLLMADELDRKRDRDAAQEPLDADSHRALAEAYHAALETPQARAALRQLSEGVAYAVQAAQGGTGGPIPATGGALPAPADCGPPAATNRALPQLPAPGSWALPPRPRADEASE